VFCDDQLARYKGRYTLRVSTDHVHGLSTRLVDTGVILNRGGSMVSGAVGKISRLCPHIIFVMQIRVIFALPSPLWFPSLGAVGSCPSRLPLDPPLPANTTWTGIECTTNHNAVHMPASSKIHLTTDSVHSCGLRDLFHFYRATLC